MVRARVPNARREDRYGNELRLVRKQRERVRRERHLGDIEFVIAQHAKEGFLDDERQIGQLDAVESHAAFHQCPRPVVVPAGHRQLKLGGLGRGRGQYRRCSSAGRRIKQLAS